MAYRKKQKTFKPNQMFDKEDFKKFVIKDQHISSLNYERYTNLMGSMGPVAYVMPHIVEESRNNMASMDVFSRLMMDRIIFLGAPIYNDVANVVTAQLLYLQSTDAKKDIMIYINSPGGSVYGGLGIYDTMQFVTPDIATICTGLAASMGAVLLAGGTKGKRACLKHARVMIHQPMGGAGGKASDIEISAQQLLLIRSELYDVLTKHTDKTKEQLEKDGDRDFWMTSDMALEYGIIDEVLVRK